MPVPVSLSVKKNIIRLNAPLRISITGETDNRIYAAFNRFKRRVCDRTGICSDQTQIPSSEDSLAAGWLHIKVDRVGQLQFGEDETYRLEATGNQVYVHATTDLGAMHSLETILQLIRADSIGYYIPDVQISDSPRFAWRSLVLDIANERISVEQIRRTLDGMSAVKMNVLQLHLSIDQFIDADSIFYSGLHEDRTERKVYTREELRAIVWYAGQRGIRVVPELNLPEFNDSRVYHDPDRLVAKMTSLFPDEFFQINGCQENSINGGERITIQRIFEILRRNGKKPIGGDTKDPVLLESYDLGRLQSAAVYYLHDPLPPERWLADEKNNRITGGQAVMMVKREEYECLDSRIWPRMAAIAERLWSPREVNDVNDMYRRLENISLQLEGLGLQHLSYRSARLRQLANGTDPGPLQILADVIEPLPSDEANRMADSRLSGLACPDPVLPRHFNQLVDSFLVTHSPDAGKRIQELLTDWGKNNTAFKELIKKSPVLIEASRLSENLSAISHAGQEALAFLRQHDRADRDWLRKQLDLLDQAARPAAGCILGVIVPIKKLVNAAGAGCEPSLLEPAIILARSNPRSLNPKFCSWQKQG